MALLFVKNMVCDRCIRVVKDELEGLGLEVKDIKLGEVELASNLDVGQLDKIREVLVSSGFDLIDDKKQSLTELVKTILIDEINHQKGKKPSNMNFSTFLESRTGYDYSYLSHLFSESMDTTIEQYIIALRIEKAKELLSYKELTINEIAWELGYSSTAHLSNQFKKVTGETPSQFRVNNTLTRKTLDRI